MQNTSNDPLIPAYIAYAVIILTAKYLGCEVEMSATAREVWEVKDCRPHLCWLYMKGPHRMRRRLW